MRNSDLATAHFAFLVFLASQDEDIVNTFGYKQEKIFQEAVRGKLMQACAEIPNLQSVSVDPLSLDNALMSEDIIALFEEEEDELE